MRCLMPWQWFRLAGAGAAPSRSLELELAGTGGRADGPRANDRGGRWPEANCFEGCMPPSSLAVVPGRRARGPAALRRAAVPAGANFSLCVGRRKAQSCVRGASSVPVVAAAPPLQPENLTNFSVRGRRSMRGDRPYPGPSRFDGASAPVSATPSAARSALSVPCGQPHARKSLRSFRAVPSCVETSERFPHYSAVPAPSRRKLVRYPGWCRLRLRQRAALLTARATSRGAVSTPGPEKRGELFGYAAKAGEISGPTCPAHRHRRGPPPEIAR